MTSIFWKEVSRLAVVEAIYLTEISLCRNLS